MNNDDPVAFFITWTVYGTHLQGDSRGWRRRRAGSQNPQPLLAQWQSDRLKYPILLLSDSMRETVELQCQHHCDHRGWKLWAVSARTNHVHVAVTSPGYSGGKVRDQLKANCTRELRASWESFRDRPVWTVGGDWECVNTEEELETVIQYIVEAQERMGAEEA
jgi:REP element-mobilizing transposase RayT